jgi:hypothetical protein
MSSPRKKSKPGAHSPPAGRRPPPAAPPSTPEPIPVPVLPGLPETPADAGDSPAAFVPQPQSAEPPSTLDPPSPVPNDAASVLSQPSDPVAQARPEAFTPEPFWSSQASSASQEETRAACEDYSQIVAVLVEIKEQQTTFARDLAQLQTQLHNLRLQ